MQRLVGMRSTTRSAERFRSAAGALGHEPSPGQDGINGLSAYRDGEAWFFVTCGLSELFVKQSDDEAVSGFGFELTMRVAASSDEPPARWPLLLLDELGRYVFESRRVLGPGHRTDFRQPLTGGNPPTRLTAVAFAQDPVLGSIGTPFGSLTFLAVVGITAEELAGMQASSTAAVLEEMARDNPRLITDAGR